MAISTNIKTLLSGDVVEWARIEFKETWDAETSLKTICKKDKNNSIKEEIQVYHKNNSEKRNVTNNKRG